MPDREKVLLVVREWLVKAEGDLQAAAHLLSLGPKCPCFIVCFHAQQCAEKYIKAMLVLELIDFPKTHDLRKTDDVIAGCRSPETDYARTEDSDGVLHGFPLSWTK